MTYEEEQEKYDIIQLDIKNKKMLAKEQKRKINKEFVKRHRKLFWVLDVLVISFLVVNFMTAMITNVLVVKSNPDIKIVEANPVQAEINDYENYPEGNNVMKMLLIQGMFWAILLTLYFYSRLHMHTHEELWMVIFLIAFYIYIIYFDFFNDLGYFIGVKIFGG